MVTHSLHDSGFAHRVINLFDGEVITENVNEPMVEILLCFAQPAAMVTTTTFSVRWE